MATRGVTPNGLVNVIMEGNGDQVMTMLIRLGRSLDPSAMAAWMQGTVDPFIRGRASDRFSSEGDDVSGPWMPLMPSTQAIRAAQQYGAAHPINIRTGEMERFITGNPGKAVPNALGATYTFPASQPQGKLGKKVRTAQAGQDYPKTVARPVIGMNERDLLAVLTDLSLYISVGQLI